MHWPSPSKSTTEIWGEADKLRFPQIDIFGSMLSKKGVEVGCEW